VRDFHRKQHYLNIRVWNMGKRQKIKVLISVIGLDGHSTGAEVVCRILMDAGMEVVYLGIYQTPEMILQAAIQEDVDVIGISSHASNYDQIGELLDLLKKNGLGHICVICGGTIPKHHVQELKKRGVSEIFPPQSTSESVVQFIVSNVKRAEASSLR
jgi:methylmalonyl-CoA mutase C-terminal domain/subunit